MSFVGLAGAVAVAAILGQAYAGAQGGAVPATTPTEQPLTGEGGVPNVTAATLTSVRIPRNVLANGQPLPAGTYMVRATAETPTAPAGQTASQYHWVEFLQAGQVRGRALADVLPAEEARLIAKAGIPSPGTARVDTLVGNEYVRVWINRDGTNYLVHLAVPGGGS
jgi:hypothetical protein